MAAEEDYDQETDQEGGGAQALAGASPQEVDAHRNVIGDVLSHLEGQGVDTNALADQAGVGTTDPSQMSHSDLISMAKTLAQQHPEVLQMVTSRYPEAQGILNTVLGSGGSGGGMFGGILGKLFGG